MSKRGSASPPPSKRARRSPEEPSSSHRADANGATMSKSVSLPPLSVSLLGVEPLDEFILAVADFVHHMILQRPNIVGNIEVEAKIGLLKDTGTGQRLQLPVAVETILEPNAVDCRFESNMSPRQHKHFNELLNRLKVQSIRPDHPSTPVEYKHLYLVDSFYPGDRNEKIRVTRDEKTGEVRECMRKIRLGDLNIYSPRRSADWRISVNLEAPAQHPIGSSTMTRKKDRLSYTHEEFIIDLTQVNSTTSPNAPSQVYHELEVEIARSSLLMSTAAQRGDPNVSEHERSAFDELIRAFVNNARILVRNATNEW
ncbi:hypothetical protein HGRIS_005971 [Hohenbuehelia grisea]|uniref:mRNA-capping enzyme subunit beta n=1 Tax=Hohenbuehelia grisea TaxID=104357 RepID=A0ABR3JZJ5_9AGAR